MISSFKTVFDYSAFEKKLKHYFSDTAPIYANIELGLREVLVSAETFEGTITVQTFIDETISVRENVDRVIKSCECRLYPKMLCVVNKIITLSHGQIKEMLCQGFGIDQIWEKQVKKVYNAFVITRFNTMKNTIDYKGEETGKVFRAYLNRPLVTSRVLILQLANGGKDKMVELYNLITENSKIEELKDAPLSKNSA